MVKRGTPWKWRKVYSIEVGDFLFGEGATEVEVISISQQGDWTDIVKVNVEERDCFFAGGILHHNKA